MHVQAEYYAMSHQRQHFVFNSEIYFISIFCTKIFVFILETFTFTRCIKIDLRQTLQSMAIEGTLNDGDINQRRCKSWKMHPKQRSKKHKFMEWTFLEWDKKPGAMHFECRNAFLTINFVKVMQANRKQALVVLRTHSALQTETLSTHFFHNFFLLPWYSVNWNELSASSRILTHLHVQSAFQWIFRNFERPRLFSTPSILL